MRALLENQFAPLTHTWGFVECPFSMFADAFKKWRKQIDTSFGSLTDYQESSQPLSDSLFLLEPLASPLNRYLLTETRSGWSAIFANGLRVNDVTSPVGYLPTVLGCRGLEVSCVPDRSGTPKQGAVRTYGAVGFSLYGPDQTDWLNRIRGISVWNDVSGWKFEAEGAIQPYEEIEEYENRRITDRFTPAMLEAYCSALGIGLFNEAFYGPQSLLVRTLGHKNPAASMSLAQARAKL